MSKIIKNKICVVCGKELEDSRNNNRRYYCIKHQKHRHVFFLFMRNVRSRFFNPLAQAEDLGYLELILKRVYQE